MKLSQLAFLVSTALCQFAAARAVGKRAISSVVNGTPMGFASATTGGGDAEPVYPTTIDELKEYLTSSDPQVIVISGEFDFSGSEGTQSLDACDAYDCTPDNGGQALLNTLDGCSTSTYSVEIDTAAYQGINVASDKTLVGKDKATLNGKGLRFVDASNIIVQNIEITNLNPKYVWGGDALSFSGTQNIWIDHVTVSVLILHSRMLFPLLSAVQQVTSVLTTLMGRQTSSLGRQHYSFGSDASSGIAISNSFINGETAQSSTCNGHTYWAMELVGADDQITFYSESSSFGFIKLIL